MAFGIYYDSPIFDNRDAICGTRTRRLNDNTYETPALAAWIALASNRNEGFADDVAAFVVDLTTGKRLFAPSFFPQPVELDIPF